MSKTPLPTYRSKSETNLLTPDDKIIKSRIAERLKTYKPRKQYSKRVDIKVYCKYHPKIELARLYLNQNLARKLHTKFKTDYFYCKKCDDVFLVLEGEII